MSTVFWLLSLFGLYVAIANIIGKAMPAPRMRRRGFARLVLPAALLCLFIALGLSLEADSTAAHAKQLLANPPTSNYVDHSNQLKKASTSVGGRLKKELLAEIKRLQPFVDQERIALLIAEAEQLAAVDNSMPADELPKRIKRIEEIAASVPKGADSDACDRLVAVVMEAHDRPIMAAAKARFGLKPSWDRDTSATEQELASLQDQLLLDHNTVELQNEVDRIARDKMAARLKHEEQLAAEKRKALLASSRQSYGELLRRPEDFVGKTTRRQGEVLQDTGDGTYRVATSKGYFGSYVDDDMLILISQDGEAAETRLVEGDVVDFAGTIMIPTSYRTILGATRTVPTVSVEWLQLVRSRR
ncbi:MAG: hypothetical protein VB144_02050 [Clostridia bacterium]|nr:hypothetical protein [Clostridia bacterium]